MIYVKDSLKVLKLYADSVPVTDKFGLSFYTAYEGNDVSLMKRSVMPTILIDLRPTEEEILMSFKSNTRNEVRKGIKEGYQIEKVDDIDFFVSYYNGFAQEKNLKPISKRDITKYGKVLIYKSTLNDQVLTMHANIVDEGKKLVRLLYSASVRFDAGVDRKCVGISNRFLHYQEFVEFRKSGYEIYDFGGINEDPNNKEQYNITQFKKGFGGSICDSTFLMSYPAYVLLTIRNIFSRKH